MAHKEEYATHTQRQPWHTKSADEVLEILSANKIQGLTEEEAKKRIAQYGPNKLPESKPDSLFLVFLRQFQSPLIYLLLLAAMILVFLEELIDAAIISFVLLFNAILGTVQEGRAQNTLLALKKFTATFATILRDGREITISDEGVVPGDIIFITEGDKIPADARLIESVNLRLDEAALTGEADPAGKHTNTVDDPNRMPAEQKNMVFKGTHVVGGRGKAVVTATGLSTLIGGISEKITTIDAEIPMQKNIRSLTHFIVAVVLFISAAIFIIGALEGRVLSEMFALSIAVIVAAVPEGLPIVVTILLAVGMWRMSKRNVLVKRLQAVEALGEARVIAVDKTGTITKNELKVQHVYLPENQFEVAGVGFEPKGTITAEGKTATTAQFPNLERIARLGMLCSEARLTLDPETQMWNVAGDPTEAAMTVFAEKAGLSKEQEFNKLPRIADIPFDSRLKYHAVLVRGTHGPYLAVCGAPEVILSVSSHIRDGERTEELVEEKRKELIKIFESLSGEGLRVLALSEKENADETLGPENIHTLTFVGFYGMKDVLREEVPDAMAKTKSAGIRVVMITGDHKITAEVIARDAGIFHDGDTIITDADIERLSNEELAKELGAATVFARITPEHKLRIVEAYRLRGDIIAMTGDGVNDALSLVAADLGVAMGKKGTEVAKEAADLILLDDNFGNIAAAIEEGRGIYVNAKKVILYLLGSNIGEILIISIALLLGWPLPLIAAQLILVNLVTDAFVDVALALEPKEKDLMKEKFVRPNKTFIDSWMARRMFLMSITIAAGTLWVFSLYFEDNIIKAMSMAVSVLAAFQWFNVWNCRSSRHSIFSLNPLGNKYLIAATTLVITLYLFVLYTPLTQQILRLEPISLEEWGLVLLVASSIIVVDELHKLASKLFQKKTSVTM